MTYHPDIVLYPHTSLGQAAVSRPVDSEMREAGAALLTVAKAVNAYGLAASHIGLAEPLVVISIGPIETRDYKLLFNPHVVASDSKSELGKEGSVSLPGVEVDVSRPVSVTLVYDDLDGGRQEVVLDGFAARVAQHEIDQMNGIFFLDKLSRLKRDAALRRFGKLARQGF